MKKFFLFVFVFMIIFMPCAESAQTVFELSNQAKTQERINNVGFKLLNAGKVDKKVVFYYINNSKIRTYSYIGLGKPRTVVVHGGVLAHCETEDEVAAILAREISHIADSYNGIMRGSFFPIVKISSLKKHEAKADKRAVDFMVEAGYDPVALIVIINKIYGQYRYEIWGQNHLTSKRMIEIYEYIYKKYPYFLANNAYKNNVYYQNFLLTSAQNRAKMQTKLESEKPIKVKYK